MDLRGTTRVSDRLVSMLMQTRNAARALDSPIEDEDMLKHALQREVDRPLRGDFLRLFRMLRTMLAPLNGHTLVSLGNIEGILLRGQKKSETISDVPSDDDVINYVLGFAEIHPDRIAEIKDLASSWRGPMTTLRRAIDLLKEGEDDV